MTATGKTLKMFIWLTLLTGLLYPLLITGIGYLTMRHKAEGSFIQTSNKIMGSRLIAQKFESDKYFWPRPSAIDYNPLASGGSNLGPLSKDLKKTVSERASKIHNNGSQGLIPPELLFASGSGLDPHISPSTAYFQVDRVAKARNLNPNSGKQQLNNLIFKLTKQRYFTLFGGSFINVLELNISLDELQIQPSVDK